MAYVGKVSIKSNAHMASAIDYIARDEKAMPLKDMKMYLKERLEHLNTIDTSLGERTTLINCSPPDVYKEFEMVRKGFKQDKGVIAHHYYQSFQKDDNVTPEQAHQIGVELARRMFPNYQVAIATHIDREHVHNHIIVNSVNLVTGKKWYSNKRSLSDIRKESDKLCLEHGLGVIKENNKYQGIDRTTYQLGLKGKSWKINLVHDLDTAVESCKSKDEFISFLNEKDYTVRYTDSHITITKNGEKKGIRVDTLAKQFGGKYTKENLEKLMGYYQAPLDRKAPVKSNNNKKIFYDKGKSNYEYYEQDIFKKNNYLPSTTEKVVRDYKTERLIRKTERSLLYSRSLIEFVLKALTILVLLPQRRKKKTVPVRYKKMQQLTISKPKTYIPFGNISYNELKSTAGDTYTCKLGIDKLLYLVNQPILYSARIHRADDSVTITIKDKDRDFLLKLLEMQSKSEQLDEQSERIKNQLTYKELKESAEQSGAKLNYLLVTAEQKRILEENFIRFAYFEKEGKINIAYLPEKDKLIKKLIYPKAENKTTETMQQKNARVYAQLKKSAALNGEKLHYKVKLTQAQLEALSKTDITFAYFTNKDDKTLYNIAYEKKDDSKVSAALAALNKTMLS